MRGGENMKAYYYYIRDADRKPIITVCLLFYKDDNIITKGLAFCCYKDVPCKKVGRRIALERALHAYSIEINDCMTTRRDNFPFAIIFDYKAYYRPKLTEYEESILRENE